MKKYTEKEIEILRTAGKKLAQIMKDLENFIQVGTIVADIDKKSLKLIAAAGAKPATVGYQPRGAKYPFPAAACVSINDEVAHGISTNNQRVLKSGDLVSIDIVIEYQNLFVDICRTYGIGNVSTKNIKLINCAREVTDQAIQAVRVGQVVRKIGQQAAQTAKKYGFTTVHELGGHGVGRKIHDQPFIPNFNARDFNEKVEDGMVLAIEPIVAEISGQIKIAPDDYLYSTVDGGNSAQFEETILVTKTGVEILTSL